MQNPILVPSIQSKWMGGYANGEENLCHGLKVWLADCAPRLMKWQNMCNVLLTKTTICRC